MPNPQKPARLYLKRSKDRDAKWVVLHNNKQHPTGCGEFEIERAQKALSNYIQSNYRPDTSKRSLSEIGCADVIALYASEVAPGLASAATIGYQGTNLLKFWGNKMLADVKGSTCRAYVKFRTETPVKTKHGAAERFVSLRTARHELKLLGTSINHWHKESLLDAVPQVTLPKVTSKRERVLERHEVAAMLRACRKLKLSHVARFILIGIYTGTRHHAILSLRWNNALVGGHVDGERSIIYRRGSAERETNKRRPPVEIPDRLIGPLRRWRSFDVGHNKGTHVINYKGQPLAKLRSAWESIVQLAGLGDDVTPHVLRHTCASWLLWKGWTIWDVAKHIGADATTVERVYGHHRKIEQDERKRA
jgi:integrase